MSPPTFAKISDSPIVPLLVTVFTSIFEVFLLCLAGYILAGRGILDKKTQMQLNRLNVSLFTPSLLFSKVAFFLSPEKLRELWIIPIIFVLVTTVSMSVSFLLGWIFGVKRSQRNFAMAASMFMNSNSLPIALMQSLVVMVPGLKWGPDDNKNAMVGRALTYLVLYSTLGMVLRWSYGVKLLAQSDPENEAVAAKDEEETSTLHNRHNGHVGFHSQEATLGPSDILPEIQVQPATHLRPSQQCRRSRFYNMYSPPETVVSTAVVNSPDASDSESDTETCPFLPGDAVAQAPAPAPGPPVRPRRHTRCLSTLLSGPPDTPFRMTLHRTRRRAYRAWVVLNEFMTVPLWAALASIIVACVYPLQRALEEHMQPVKGSLTSVGNCSIPLTLIVLGAYFYPPPPEEGAAAPERTLRPMASTTSLVQSVREMFKKPVQQSTHAGVTGGPKEPSRPGETKTVVIAVTSRMIITPLLLLPLFALGTMFDLHQIFDDPVFVVANVLLVSSPPALTLAQITQAASGDAFERLISRTIFWAYCVVTPPATIAYVVIGLVLAKL
ncbi:membrane transport protein-domain-containing protein [Mycena rebaudengoi]|nr:membrane transport protein-domain-containing protein [Mycena rebaudengoi]